jgi:hypothetical protein
MAGPPEEVCDSQAEYSLDLQQALPSKDPSSAHYAVSALADRMKGPRQTFKSLNASK